MRKTVNIEELTRKLNEFRMSNQNKTFTYSELNQVLHNLGFNKVVISYIIKVFPSEKIGTFKVYSMDKNPIHKSFVAGVYSKQAKIRKAYYDRKNNIQKNIMNEEEALNILSQKGYQIRKCIGFDLDRFKKENPVLYTKYLKYEIV